MGVDASGERECSWVAQCRDNSGSAGGGWRKRRKQGTHKYQLLFGNSKTSSEGITGEKEIVYLEVSTAVRHCCTALLYGTAVRHYCMALSHCSHGG